MLPSVIYNYFKGESIPLSVLYKDVTRKLPNNAKVAGWSINYLFNAERQAEVSWK